MIQFDEEKQKQRVSMLHQKEEEELVRILSAKYNLKYANLATVSLNVNAFRVIPEKKARETGLAPFDIIEKKVKIGIISPNNPLAQQTLEKLKKKGYEVEGFMISKQSAEKVWDRYKDLSFSVKTEEGLLSVSDKTAEHIMSEKREIADIQNIIADTLKLDTANKISQLFDVIVTGALALSSSDIHIEPEETFTRIRYRIDGILTNITEIDSRTYNLLLSRAKLISGLKLNIKKNAQDGRFSIKLNDAEIEVRVSTMPGAYGESIVTRLLNPDSISVPINELGIEPHLLKVLEEEISKPNGMVLNTGPTGSGKTTTLYAFLDKVYSPEIKIITIEDPIEYHIKGITQTQTNKNKGYTFASGLRSALRQDPDVIMVGEIRDSETAEIAIHSALTGHLVLSTLHTNNAAGTFPRFIGLGMSPDVLGSAVNLAMAQRLVRKLCKHCKKEVDIKSEDKEIVDKIIDGVVHKEKYEINNEGKVYEPTGCKECSGIGYKGRIGIFEAIRVNKEIEKIIITDPGEREINRVARSQGIMNMKEDGIVKVLNGVTSLEELRRVINLSIDDDSPHPEPEEETFNENNFETNDLELTDTETET